MSRITNKDPRQIPAGCARSGSPEPHHGQAFEHQPGLNKPNELTDLDYIAVTQGQPGYLSDGRRRYSKALGAGTRYPGNSEHHLEAHIYANFINAK